MSSTIRHLRNTVQTLITQLQQGINLATSEEMIGEVRLRDQASLPIMQYAITHAGIFTISGNITAGDVSFVATAGHGIQTGNCILIQDTHYFYQFHVINVDTNTIYVDSPFDHGFEASLTTGIRGSANLAVNGASTPVIFRFKPTTTTRAVKWHITHISFHLEDNSEMDDSLFGGITALTKGILLRKVDGEVFNYLNIKDNASFRLKCDESQYATKAKSGFCGLNATKRFNGTSYEGVVMELDSSLNGEIQIVVQDDLTGLTNFNVFIHGHEVV